LHGELQFLLRSGIVDLYQPLPWAGIENGPRCAGTMERWAAINQELGSSSGSAMDIGCNLGYFTFQMARRDFFCLGIEKDSLLYHLCNLTKEIYGFEQAVFMKMMVDESSSQKLPSADVTLFLSVLHHVIWRSGMAAATRLLTGILSKTRRVLFF